LKSANKVKPFILRPWQCFVVGSLFGWFATVPEEDEDGKLTGETVEIRRFRRAYVEIGKGNGKSPMAAGIGHYMHSAYGKVRAEVYSAATDQDQAAILFRDAVAMYERSPALRKRRLPGPAGSAGLAAHVSRAQRRLHLQADLSSAKKGKSGIRPDCALIDEVHEHPDNSVIEMMRAGTKGKQDALIFEITNSGFDKKSVCGQEHDVSVEVVTTASRTTPGSRLCARSMRATSRSTTSPAGSRPTRISASRSGRSTSASRCTKPRACPRKRGWSAG
jgi:phage terminase large subunit-like protein